MDQKVSPQLYEDIYMMLNQPNLNEVSKSFPNLTWNLGSEIREYFSQREMKILNLNSLTVNDERLLEELKIDKSNLQLIRYNNRALENLYINSFNSSKNRIELTNNVRANISEKTKASPHYIRDKVIFQQSIVETKYIYTICPFSGEILRSNQSFYINVPIVAFYRFVSKEVFYLLVTDEVGLKRYIYFPIPNLLVKLENTNQDRAIKSQILRFQVASVVRWKKIKSYISNNEDKKLVALISSHNNLAHYVYNELTAIHRFLQNNILNKIDYFLVGPYEHIDFEKLFPEVSKDKIIKINENKSISDFIIDNNCIAVRFTDCFIRQDLIDRIYNLSVKKYNPNLSSEIQEAKKLFPLLWISIRTHNVVWVSHVEGISQIIKKLHLDYPNLGVIFNGWPGAEKSYPKMEQMISQEKSLVKEIVNLIPSEVKWYDIIGCNVYESIVWGRAANVFMGNQSANTFVYMIFISSNPGIIYGNKTFSIHDERLFSFRENPVSKIRQIPRQYITDVENIGSHSNWDCDWQVIYKKLKEVIDDIGKKS